MTEEFDALKKGYRDIEAPQYLVTRIRAEVADRPLRTHTWMRAGATVVAIGLVVLLAPYLGDDEAPPAAKPVKPSLSAIAVLKPDAPPGTTVSLSKLRTVKRPVMPARPRSITAKPQPNSKSESDLLEEKDHAHI